MVQMKFLGTISIDFYVTDQLLTRYSVFMTYLKKCEYSGTTCQLFIGIKIQLGQILYRFGSDMPVQLTVMAN